MLLDDILCNQTNAFTCRDSAELTLDKDELVWPDTNTDEVTALRVIPALKR